MTENPKQYSHILSYNMTEKSTQKYKSTKSDFYWKPSYFYGRGKNEANMKKGQQKRNVWCYGSFYHFM